MAYGTNLWTPTPTPPYRPNHSPRQPGCQWRLIETVGMVYPTLDKYSDTWQINTPNTSWPDCKCPSQPNVRFTCGTLFKLAVALIFALTVNSLLFFASHTVVLFTRPAFILAAVWGEQFSTRCTWTSLTRSSLTFRDLNKYGSQVPKNHLFVSRPWRDDPHSLGLR